MLKTALSIIEGRVNSESPEIINLYPLRDGTSTLDVALVNELSRADLFGSNRRVFRAATGAVGYVMQVVERSRPMIAVHVSRSTKRGMLAIKFRPITFHAQESPAIHFTVKREVSKKDLIAMYEKAVERFSKRKDIAVSARVAAESKNIESIVRELPRDLEFGDLKFKRYSAERDPSEDREYALYECALDHERHWAVRVYVYFYPPNSNNIFVKHLSPLSYYVGFRGDHTAFADVLEETMELTSTTTLIHEIGKSLRWLIKAGKERLMFERAITDKKDADEFMRKYKAALK